MGPYTTSGAKILDKNGNPHLFRGLDLPGLESNCSANLQPNEYYVMNSLWGANVVRLPLNQDCWLNDSSNPNYNSSYASNVDDQVQAAQQNNMDIILDLHWSDQGTYSVATPCLSGGNCQQTMPDQHSLTFWQQVAAKYASSPNVLFELYNEPHPGSASPSTADWSTWLNGGTCSTETNSSTCGAGTSPGYTAVGMQALYNAVRAQNANNLVVIGGLNWAYDLSEVSSNAVNGTNILYNTHPYSDKSQNPGPSDWQTEFGSLSATYPVIATEFGYLPTTQTTLTTESATDCNPSFDTMFTQYANQQGSSPTPPNMLSWTAWAFIFVGGDECNYPSLIYDSNYDPNAPGTVVQNALLAGPP